MLYTCTSNKQVSGHVSFGPLGFMNQATDKDCNGKDSADIEEVHVELQKIRFGPTFIGFASLLINQFFHKAREYWKCVIIDHLILLINVSFQKYDSSVSAKTLFSLDQPLGRFSP